MIKPSEMANFINPGDSVYIQLAHNALAMRLHCANADPDGAGDFFIGKAFGEMSENFSFATGELSKVWSITGTTDGLVQSNA